MHADDHVDTHNHAVAYDAQHDEGVLGEGNSVEHGQGAYSLDADTLNTGVLDNAVAAVMFDPMQAARHIEHKGQLAALRSLF
ncbi:hypothetical protein C9I94_15835 [Photobacterium swingsii]|uniref:Uncharacterized protein n=1 Tax=Photobacterium swingsii TaxID=680026 RepID=A0A2T3P520_9GAMM|nr:hypothetical protein C9I94_15835 [Photobacterium swingsii]